MDQQISTKLGVCTKSIKSLRHKKLSCLLKAMKELNATTSETHQQLLFNLREALYAMTEVCTIHTYEEVCMFIKDELDGLAERGDIAAPLLNARLQKEHIRIKLIPYIVLAINKMNEARGNYKGKITYENEDDIYSLAEEVRGITFLHSDGSNDDDTYCNRSILMILEALGVVKKVKNAYHDFNKIVKGRCAGYAVTDEDKFQKMLYGKKQVVLMRPSRLINRLKTKLESYDEGMILQCASVLVTKIDKKWFNIAKERRYLQRKLNKAKFNGEISEEVYYDTVKLYDKNMSISQASILHHFEDLDLEYLMEVHRDTYVGRLYSKITTLKSDYRKGMRCPGELDTYIKGGELVEIDLSQNIFNDLINLYWREKEMLPSFILMQAAARGMSRELLASKCCGTYGKNENFIDFDNFKDKFDHEGTKQIKEYKEQIKKWSLAAVNCKRGTKAGVILDDALEKLSPEFAKWISWKRRGRFHNDKDASLLPHDTLAEEVRLMFGIECYRSEEILTDKSRAKVKIKDLPFEMKKISKGIVDFAMELGVNYLITIHDAIICKRTDISKIKKAILLSCRENSNFLVPAYKIEPLTSGEYTHRFKGGYLDPDPIVGYMDWQFDFVGYPFIENSMSRSGRTFFRPDCRISDTVLLDNISGETTYRLHSQEYYYSSSEDSRQGEYDCLIEL